MSPQVRAAMRGWSLVLAAALLLAAGFGLWKWRDTSHHAARRAADFEHQRRIAATEAALDRPIELTDRWLALFELPDAIHGATGLEVELDAKGLEDEGVKPQTPLAWVRGRFSARSALDMLLEPLGLGYDVEEGRIVIAGLYSLREQNELRAVVYPLPQPDFAAAAVTSDDWQELVTTIVQPESWDDVGGSAHCEVVPGGLVVVQTDHAHRQIRQLLETLGSLRSPPKSYASVPIAPFLMCPTERHIMATLAEPTTIDAEQMPLSQVIDQLARRHGIPMLLHVRKLNEAGVSTDARVTASLTDVSLAAALRLMLDEFELTYVVRHEALIVTTPEDAESPDNMLLVAHPVHDLVDWSENPARVGDYDPLIDLITTAVAPESWMDVGGPGSIKSLDGWLLLSQTHEVHAQVESLLASLRRALAYESHPLVLGIAGETPRAQRLQAALAREIGVSFIHEPLNKAIAKLAEQLGLPIVLAARQLEEAGVNTDTPVTCNLASAPLEVRLRLLLDPLGLTYAIRDEVLLITTPEDAESPDHMLIRVYDVRPMLDPDLGIADPDNLIDVLTTLITPEAWCDVGGPASIKAFRGLLVICHTHEGHCDTERLLAALEEHCLDTGRRDTQEPWVIDIHACARDAKVASILKQRTMVDIRDEPLDAALKYLAAQYQLPLALDLRQLEAAGVNLESPVNFAVHDISLESALRLILDERDLTCQIRDGVLVVAPKDIGYKNMPLVAYRVDGLVSRREDSELLVGTITSIIAPDSWVDTGGDGAARALGDWLVVSQSRDVHNAIQRLLLQLQDFTSTRNTAVPSVAAENAAALLANDDNRPSVQRLRTALGRELAISFVETPLQEAVAHIAAETGIPIVIAARRLEEAGVNLDTPVNIEVPPAPLANQLRLLLSPLDLCFVVRHEVLVITTSHDVSSESRMPIRVYDIRPLASPIRGLGASDPIVNLVVSLIDGDSWVDIGGPGGATEFRGRLIVRQREEVHQRIEQLLSALTAPYRRLADPPANRPVVIDIDANSTEQQIECALEKRVDVAIAGQPLVGVLKGLADKHGFPVVFDERAADVARFERVTFTARGTTLETVLDQLLKPWNLAWTIRDRVLLVTEDEHARQSLDVRLYRVDDLLVAKKVHSAELIEEIMRTTGEPKDKRGRNDWVDNGGTALVCELGTDWIAIAGDLHLHHRVADALLQWRTETIPQRERERRDFASGRAPSSQSSPPLESDDHSLPAADPFGMRD